MLKIILALFCLSFLSAVEEERASLLATLSGEWIARGVFAAAKLDLAEHLKNAKTAEELSQITGAKRDKIERLLKALVSHGLFQEVEEGLFVNNSQSELLQKDHPQSLYNLTLFYGEEIHKAWEGFIPSLSSEEPSFNLVFGKPVFAYFKDHPERLFLFQSAMREKSQAVIHSVVEKGDFARAKTIIDIGGGRGQFLLALQKKFPEKKYTLFELPEVSEKIKSPHFDVVAGDFFKEVPKGFDTYLLKSILHDWDDERAVEILTRLHEAMSDQAELMIIDVVLQDEASYAYAMDLLMLAVTGGKERSLEGFLRLASKTGFEMKEVIETSTEFSLIVLKKR